MSLKGDGGWVESLYITARRRCRFMISLAFIRFIKTKRTPKHTFLWKVAHVSHGLDPARLWGWGAGDDTYLHVLLFHPFCFGRVYEEGAWAWVYATGIFMWQLWAKNCTRTFGSVCGGRKERYKRWDWAKCESGAKLQPGWLIICLSTARSQWLGGCHYIAIFPTPAFFPPKKNIFCFAFFASLRFSLVAAEGFLLIYRVFLLFVEPREKAESIPELNFVCKNISGSEVEANNRQAWHGQKAKSKIRFLLAEALNVSVWLISTR